MHLLYVSALGGGLDTNVRVLGPALARAGHQVSVLYVHTSAERAAPSPPPIEGCQVFHAPLGNWHYYLHRATLGLSSLPALIREIENARAMQEQVQRIGERLPLDLIEIPEIYVPPSLFGIIPYVTRLHASGWACRELCADPIPLSDRVERRWEKETLDRARAISSPSRFLEQFIRRECHLGTRPIEIIAYPMDTCEFTPHGARADPPTILFVGRVEKRKGADSVLGAIPLVWQKFPETVFVFAGSVNPELKEQITPFQADSRVRFLGVRPRAELIVSYQRATVFVAPSLWDNSPNTVYEAMACGTAVIASQVGGIPELVDEGETGLLVPPSDERALAEALLALLGDAGRRERMGAGARAKAVAHFAIGRILERTLNFYERVLKP